jgi:hypothetical protein
LASRLIFATLSKINPAVKLSRDRIIKDAAKIAEGKRSTSPVWKKSKITGTPMNKDPIKKRKENPL